MKEIKRKKCQNCGKEFKDIYRHGHWHKRKFCSLSCSVSIQNTKRKEQKSPVWKGNNVGYDGLHWWIKSRLGKPTKCEFCGMDGLVGRAIHWANKSGRYLRDLSDWLRLCLKCHKAYDAGKLQIYG